MSSNKKLQGASGFLNLSSPLNVEDVFSTYLYDVSSSGTTVNNGIDLETNVNDGRVLFGAVGVGTTSPRAAVDFASAGDSTALANGRYMLPPKITTTQRNALSSVVAGAIIYNINDNKLQCYNGSSWNNLF